MSGKAAKTNSLNYVIKKFFVKRPCNPLMRGHLARGVGQN
jgi:hypothetical protein